MANFNKSSAPDSSPFKFWNWNLFGLSLKDSNEKANTDVQKTFVIPSAEDGALQIVGAPYFVSMVSANANDTTKTEFEDIIRYRELSLKSEVEFAIDNIVNESIVKNDDGKIIQLNLDNIDLSDNIKTKIEEEFHYVLRLLNWNSLAPEIFKKWYVDGRIFYHKVYDETRPQDGIKSLKWVDPRCIRKVREIIRQKDQKTGLDMIKGEFEYYLYNERGIVGMANITIGSKLNVDSVTYVPSGLFDSKKNSVVSYLNKAMKIANQLSMVEDALVIYRLSRAAERRVFYIDVGNMAPQRVDGFMQQVASRYKNKMVYDAGTGEVKDSRNILSMMEDYYFPRREGGRGTEVTTLPGAQGLNEIADIEYFQKKLFKSLNVPISRLESQEGFSLGRSTEISRDEVQFNKFIKKLRNKFSTLFDDLLKTQLIMKGICDAEQWEQIRYDLVYSWSEDNYFDELKKLEIQRERYTALQLIDQYKGIYVSGNWIRKNVLKQSNDEIQELDKEIEVEAEQLRFISPQLVQVEQMFQQGEINAAQLNNNGANIDDLNAQAGNNIPNFEPQNDTLEQDKDEEKMEQAKYPSSKFISKQELNSDGIQNKSFVQGVEPVQKIPQKKKHLPYIRK